MDDTRFLSMPDGCRIAYACKAPRNASGRATSPLLVPALSWLGRDLDGLAGPRTIVFHDVRGRGRSQRVDEIDRLSLEADAGDLAFLQQHLAREDSRFGCVDLLGWSYYAAVVMHFALLHPGSVRRIVLVGPSAPRAKPWFGRFLDCFAKRVDVDAVAELERDRRGGLAKSDPFAFGRRVHAIFHRAYVVDPAALARMRSDPCVDPNSDAERVNGQARRVLEKLGDYDWRAAMAALQVPLLILHGSEDPIPVGGSKEWCSTVPGARLHVLEGVGHMPWIEAPALFEREVEAFLSAAE